MNGHLHPLFAAALAPFAPKLEKAMNETSPPVACPKCQDTGRTAGSRYLDCVHCEAATERAALEAAVAALPPMDQMELVWYVYQAGKKAGGRECLTRINESS